MKNVFWCVLSVGFLSCGHASYLDPSLPVDQRVDLLMKEMTLEEKIGQMNLDFNVPEPDLTRSITSDKIEDIKYKRSEGDSLYHQWIEDVKAGKMGVTRNIRGYKKANEFQRYAEQSRLKIPLLIVDNFVHGVGLNGHTIFPTYISMASSFDPDLVRRAGAVTAREGRLMGINWTFAPTVDISRDSRWGRTGESWGEDPLLASRMGVAMVNGLQCDNELPYRMIACLKHYVGGGQGLNGLNFASVDISERTLRDVYLAPFKAAVEAGAGTIMVGHNDVMGVPCHCNKFLLTDILREEYGFKGAVITDFRDIERLLVLHKVAATFDDAVEMAINAGVDVHNHGKLFCESMLRLVKAGKISEKRVDEAVRAILTLKFKFGLFEHRYISEEDFEGRVCTEEDRQLALQLARESIVLLKNKQQLLPLKSGQKVLLTGTNVNNYSILGDWVSSLKYDNVIKIKEGFEQEKPDGIDLDCYTYPAERYEVDESYITETVRRARQSDVVVLVLGGNHFRPTGVFKTGGENCDVQDIELFGNQLELLRRVKETGKPVVTVLVGGRNLAFENADPYCDALIQAWEPGMMGGKALAEIVYGKVSPSGRLPMSGPRTNGQVHVWYSHNPSAYFRKYVFGKMGPLYTFGDGLSYTTFSYDNLRFSKQIAPGDTQVVMVDVTNTGNRAADEVVLCYLNDKVSSVVTPLKKLVAFTRITLQPGEKRTVKLEIPADQMALYDVHMNRVVEPGEFELFVDDLKGSYEVTAR